ncbi:helix-turn-helix domain-containing protein [Weissella viridescens]|uniref:helix-turn-helix domain-containing protein n=1 Tax=Weissella viridescens TaxID=1629 RepID=UPI00092E22A4|nr:helix-turn-helix transcriptional regulator [Weissella viridescens]
MTFFERTRDLAKQRGMNLKQVAQKAGLSENALYRYNQGINPKYPTVKAIADVLGVSVDYLLGNTDEMHPKQEDASAENADLKKYFDENIPLQFDGREIPQEDLKIIKRILESMDDE